VETYTVAEINLENMLFTQCNEVLLRKSISLNALFVQLIRVLSSFQLATGLPPFPHSAAMPIICFSNLLRIHDCWSWNGLGAKDNAPLLGTYYSFETMVHSISF